MTTLIPLADQWVNVGTGPALLEAAQGTVLLHFADTAPPPDTQAFHRLGAGWPLALTYAGTRTAYARSGAAGAALIVTEQD